MRKKISITIMLLCSVALCIAAAAGIAGKWTATLKPGDGSTLAVTYNFKVDGNMFTGDLLFPNDNDFAITDGKIKGDSISFSVVANGQAIPNMGRVYTDSIGLDILINGTKFHNTLLRGK